MRPGATVVPKKIRLSLRAIKLFYLLQRHNESFLLIMLQSFKCATRLVSKRRGFAPVLRTGASSRSFSLTACRQASQTNNLTEEEKAILNTPRDTDNADVVIVGELTNIT
jgi:hypothetical protein